MSDYTISLVPIVTEYPNAKQKAAEIINWLISRNIIQPMPSICIGSAGLGYAPAAQAGSVTEISRPPLVNLIPNGLEIITERQVFDTGGNGIEELICPACKKNIVTTDWDLDPWYKQESNLLECPICGIKSEIHRYTFEPTWGFSNLGFKFWNWPRLTQEFIHEFEQRLKCNVSIVYQHI